MHTKCLCHYTWRHSRGIFYLFIYIFIYHLYISNIVSFLCVSAILKHVCLSVTRWHGIKTAERLVMISSPHDSPFILVLCIPRSSRNSDGVTPCEGAKYRWGIKFARFSTNKSLYLANDTRYRHGCYGRRIGNHTQAFEWQFQWPKSVFKVMILYATSNN